MNDKPVNPNLDIRFSIIEIQSNEDLLLALRATFREMRTYINELEDRIEELES